MEQNQSSSSNNKTNRILIILLALSLIMNFYLWQNKQQVVKEITLVTDSLAVSKAEVDRELAEALDELNSYKTKEIPRLDSLLDSANTTIELQRARIEKLLKSEKNSASLNKKLKAELEELKRLKEEYLEKIDALLVENNQLKQEKQTLTEKVSELNTDLEKTISTASVLKTEYVKVNAYKKRSNGKLVQTVMAKRTNKIDVCFSVMDNKIAKAGDRDVYLRVVEPGGKTLGDRSAGSATFKLAGTGEDVQFTSSKKISYNNQKEDLCLNWEEAERAFTPGDYIVEIYIDGLLSSSTSIKLEK